MRAPQQTGSDGHADPKAGMGKQSGCSLVRPSKEQLRYAAGEEHGAAPLGALRFEHGRQRRRDWSRQDSRERCSVPERFWQRAVSGDAGPAAALG